MGKAKLLRGKILVSVVALLSISLLVLGGTAITLLSISSQTMLSQTLTELAGVTSERVEQEILVYKNIAGEIGSVARLSNESPLLRTKRN